VSTFQHKQVCFREVCQQQVLVCISDTDKDQELQVSLPNYGYALASSLQAVLTLLPLLDLPSPHTFPGPGTLFVILALSAYVTANANELSFV